MEVFSPLDGVVLALMLVALARGFFIGLIRESFSIAALAGGLLAVRTFTGPAAAWLVSATNGEVGTDAAPWIAGAALGIASVLIIGVAGRWLRRGVQAAGLGWADRLGGSALGAAEGGLLAAVLILGAVWWFGDAHPIVQESRSVVAYQTIQEYVQERAGELPDVAAPFRK